MPALAFSAHAATDILDITAHGLNTGDGPGTPIVPGGSSGGLVTANDYWIIKVDADHVKLATSSTNANAGTAVNVTSDVSGVLGIGLPFRRARTYVAKAVDSAGSQVKSADLNSLQAAEVAGLHGLITRVIPSQRWVSQGGSNNPLVHNVGIASGNGAGGVLALCGLEVVKGETLFEVRVRLKPDTGNVVRVRLFETVDDGAEPEIAGPTDSVGVAWQTITFTNLVRTPAAGAMYAVRASRQSGASLGDGFGQVEIDTYKAS